jgi:AraC-like DNA-binding protein
VERLNRQQRVALDGILSALRVQSTVFCRSELRAPWGFAVKPRDASVFHILVSGSCWLQVEDGPDAVELTAGDFALLAKGSGHVVRDDPSSPVRWLDDLLREEPFDGTLRHGGAGARTELLCGGFALSGYDANPVLAALPDVVHVPASEKWVEPTVQLVRDELARASDGSDAVVTRLADVLLLQAIRAALRSDGRGRLSLLSDREISRALSLVNDSPEHGWTVSELASAVALSRSAFAGRFRALVGESPMRYVRRCRLTKAAELLRTTNASLAEIAIASGYRSEASLSKAFKRAFALSPGRYRMRDEATLVAG